MREWLRRIFGPFLALAAAVAAIFWTLSASKHQRRAAEKVRQVRELTEQQGSDLIAAAAEQERAIEHTARAIESLDNGRRAIEKIKETGHESMADRIAAYNRRVRDRT